MSNESRPRRRLDTAGRAQYVRKSTAAEIDRRNALIAKLYRKGHSNQEICEALGVAVETVRVSVRRLGLADGKRVKGRGPITYSCPWRDEDVPVHEREQPVPPGVQQSRWRQSRIIGMAQMLNDEYRESNFSNILANQATDAEEAGDHGWGMEALATFTSAIEKLERARRVLTDDSYRALCRDTLEGVEQMRHAHTPLRAVR